MSRLQFSSLTIDEIQDQTSEAYTLFFQKPDDQPFDYQPGQYLTLKVDYEGEELRRAFSLSSAPELDDRLAITVKREPGGRVSNYLRDHFQVGDQVESLPPRGRFTVDLKPERPRHYLLIGGGSGITPLYSITRSVLAAEPESEVSLWYGNRSRASIIFREELGQLSQTYGPRLHVLHSLSQPEDDWKGYRGRLDQERVYDLISEVFMQSELPKTYYICGPQGLMEGAQNALRKHAVNFNDVHSESFQAELPSEAETDASPEPGSNGQSEPQLQEREVRVYIDGDDALLTVHPDETILSAAEEAGLDPPFSCRSGVCATCTARLVKGQVHMDRSQALSEEEVAEGYILTCQSHPLDDEVEVRYE
jgi:ring-1,2-phenylacetyl-CoA epoxidase subunit PaaE